MTVAHCAVLSDSAQYYNAQSLTPTARRFPLEFGRLTLTPRSIILRGDYEKYEYLGENETKFENILNHWSVAQAGSTDAKNWGSKISLDCPFKVLQHKAEDALLLCQDQ